MNLTLCFNPAYDGGTYLTDPAGGTASFGSKTVGTLGLLEELELRLGLTAQEKGAHELLPVYHNAAIAATEKDPSLIFRESLELAPLKTASELLAWRDELVLSGWTKDAPVPESLTAGGRKILSAIAAVERALPPSFRTLADRWTAILRALREGAAPEGLHVELTVREEHLHPLYREILRCLRDKGVSVKDTAGDGTPETEYKHFHDSADACWWAASKAGSGLIICSDTHTLDAAMTGLGRQPVGAVSPASLRPVEHLLSGAMMLLADAYDIEALRDYLSCPYHPLNKFELEDGKKMLRRELLSHIISQGGFGENNKTHISFDGIIGKYANGDKKTLAEIRRFLPEAGPVTFSRIQALCQALSDWAGSCLGATDGKPTDLSLTGQWSALIGYCRSLESICRETGMDKRTDIRKDELRRALLSVYEPDELTVSVATVGASAVVPSIEGIASDVEEAVWIAPANTPAPQPLPFLCEEDVVTLEKELPHVWMRRDALLFADDAFRGGLSHIKDCLTVLYCDTARGEKQEKHPFLLRAKEKLEELAYEGIPKESSAPVVGRPANTFPLDTGYTLSKPATIVLPAHESPSSIETMFSCPFDWLTQRVLGLYDEHDSTLSTTEGNVAHSIIHRICEIASAGGKDVTSAAFGKVFDEKYKELFDEAVEGYGAELLLPENRLECKQFRTILHDRSIPGLMEILSHSGLVIVGSEKEFHEVDLSEPVSSYATLVLTGTIDLLTRNKAGEYVVIDFKWAGSQGRKDREEQIKKGEDYQLALYRRVLEKEGRRGAAQAFYMLRTAELLTAYPCFSNDKGAVEPVKPGRGQKSYDDTIAYIHERHTEIVGELVKGSIECNKPKKYESNMILKGNLK